MFKTNQGSSEIIVGEITVKFPYESVVLDDGVHSGRPGRFRRAPPSGRPRDTPPSSREVVVVVVVAVAVVVVVEVEVEVDVDVDVDVDVEVVIIVLY